MKKILKYVILILFIVACNPQTFAATQAIKQAPSIIIEKGTFMKGFARTEISTATSDIGDEVCFINSLDMYAQDTDVIPAGSKFMGVIEDLREPVQGTNAALKIKFTKVITPNNKIIPINAYIYNENDNYIGGERTAPLYYNKMPHYTEGWKGGILQYAPTDIRYPGEHTVIKAGAELNIILIDDLKIN